jgi:hypothetical protein
MPLKFGPNVRSIKIFPINADDDRDGNDIKSKSSNNNNNNDENDNNKKDDIDLFSHRVTFTTCQKIQVNPLDIRNRLGFIILYLSNN